MASDGIDRIVLYCDHMESMQGAYIMCSYRNIRYFLRLDFFLIIMI